MNFLIDEVRRVLRTDRLIDIFCLKESLTVQLPARAVIIVDLDDRRRLMSSPKTQWYRDQVDSVENLIAGSPIVEVFFQSA